MKAHRLIPLLALCIAGCATPVVEPTSTRVITVKVSPVDADLELKQGDRIVAQSRSEGGRAVFTVQATEAQHRLMFLDVAARAEGYKQLVTQPVFPDVKAVWIELTPASETASASADPQKFKR